MIYKYSVNVNNTKSEMDINIPDILLTEIKNKVVNVDEYIVAKLNKYQWCFNNNKTHLNIIADIEIDMVYLNSLN